MRNLKEKAKNFGQKLAVGAGVVAVGIGSAMAQSDPTAQVVQAVKDGGENGVKVAVAVVIALWSITAIYLMRRKG